MPTSRRLLIAALALTALAPLRADTTLNWKITWKPGGLLPPQALAQAHFPAGLIPSEEVYLMKGTKVYTAVGPFVMIADFAAHTFTLLDAQHQRYATFASPAQADSSLLKTMPAIPQMPPQASAILQGMKLTVTSHPTDNTAIIAGVPTTETDYTVTLGMSLAALMSAATHKPTPPGAAALLAQPQEMMRLELQLWTAPPTASPVLAEYEATRQRILEQENAKLLQSVLTEMENAMPDEVGKQLAALIQQMRDSKAVALRTQATLYLPMVGTAAAMAQMANPKAAAQLQGMDPSAPLGEVTMEATEISDAPLADSQFEVPAGYSAEPLPDLMKAILPAMPAPTITVHSPRTQPLSHRPTLPPLPDIPKLAAGEHLRATQLGWMQPSVGSSSHDVIADSRFPALIEAITPYADFHMGSDMALARAFESVLQGPAFPVAAYDGGQHLIVGTRRGANARGRALLWLNPAAGEAVGGLLLYFSNGSPSPALTLFSTQAGAPVHALDQLPPGFAADLAAWGQQFGLPERPATFFIDHDGTRSLILHPPANCAGAARELCEAADSDAAETDLQAALYLAQQHFGMGTAAAQVLAKEQQDWLEQRAHACANPTHESPTACRARMDRQRTRALLVLPTNTSPM